MNIVIIVFNIAYFYKKLMYKENFSRRHIGPSTSELNDMLKIIE